MYFHIYTLIKMKIIIIALVFVVSNVCAQTTVDRVHMKDSRKYMTDVIQEVVYKVEELGWSNLKLPDMTFDINQQFIKFNYTGTLTYSNGFLVSIYDLSITNSSFNQIWTTVDGAVRADIRGQLRMTSVSLGYDIKANFSDGVHHYTGVITHPLLTFDFNVYYWPVTHQKSVNVAGNQARSTAIIDILPRDSTSDALTFMFDNDSTKEGIQRWGPEVFLPIASDVIQNIVPFPGLCYNCPLTN